MEGLHEELQRLSSQIQRWSLFSNEEQIHQFIPVFIGLRVTLMESFGERFSQEQVCMVYHPWWKNRMEEDSVIVPIRRLVVANQGQVFWGDELNPMYPALLRVEITTHWSGKFKVAELGDLDHAWIRLPIEPILSIKPQEAMRTIQNKEWVTSVYGEQAGKFEQIIPYPAEQLIFAPSSGRFELIPT